MRILFITSTRIGDVILSTGVLQYLMDAHPQARFTIACGKIAAPLFRAWPRVDAVIAMVKRRYSRHWFELWRATSATRWDYVVDLRGSWTSKFLSAKARFIHPGTNPRLRAADDHAAALGLQASPPLRLYLDDAARAFAEGLLGGDPRPILALSPGAAKQEKRWGPEGFISVARALLAPGGALAGARALTLGGPGEEQLTAKIAAGLSDFGAIDGAARIGLVEAAACLARCRLVIANDSGLMHMAAAMGAPVLGLFGPTDDRRYAPFGRFTAVTRPDSGAKDIHALEPQRVIEAAQGLVRASKTLSHSSL